ncbi:pleckstrin homology domain-containing family A member 6-like isoform X2 [Stegostoma tigrinum]|uniref:pleckstrin homology domain-containing family A member 6-like isoform X2 n=1 Tax=Stegostoma tigrinum TaxID=3053191 RepID=UPI0028700F39|nr:pleckstrin homology domain-containing family A member 6-like isoform X2 [Stegostoma tigrinum]
MTETHVDLLLTRLCGQDRMLQALLNEATQLQAEKAMEQCWSQYKLLETELQTLWANTRQGSTGACQQEQGEAQRDLWMIDDVFSGLSSNRKRFQAAIESNPQSVMLLTAPAAWDLSPELLRVSPQTAALLPPLPAPMCRQSPPHGQAVADVPQRPPLPREVDYALCNNSEYSEPAAGHHPSQREQKQKHRETNTDIQHDPASNGSYKGQRTRTVGPNRKGKMSAEEQMERMKRHQEAHLQERRSTGALSQQRVAVSPVMRGTSPRTSKLNSVSLLANRPVTADVVPSRTRPGYTPNSLIKPTTASETPETTNVTTSSKLITTLSSPRATAESQAQKNNRIVRKECKPSTVVITSRYIDVNPETPLSPEQLQEKERTSQKIKTMIANTS